MKFDGVPFVLLLVARRVSVEMGEGEGDDTSVDDEAVEVLSHQSAMILLLSAERKVKNLIL